MINTIYTIVLILVENLQLSNNNHTIKKNDNNFYFYYYQLKIFAFIDYHLIKSSYIIIQGNHTKCRQIFIQVTFLKVC